MTFRTLTVVAAGCSLAAVLAGGGCGDGPGDAGPSGATVPPDGCGSDERERIDPSSAIHVLTGADGPAYLTDPPTSGPHVPGPVLDGVLADPLPRPQQVGHLEAGGVLLQHRSLRADEQAALEALARAGVAVVPNPDLPSPIVATAWTRKLRCTVVDPDALADFVDAHLGNGPGSD